MSDAQPSKPGRLGLCWIRTNADGVSTLSLAVTDPGQWRHGLAAASVYVLRMFLFDVVKVDDRARDEEIQRLKDELAKANAELERIKRRLAKP